MSYVRQPVGEDPLQVWGAVGALFILFLVVVWLFLPEVVYATCLILHTLWGFIDWGPFHEYAAPRYNLLAITGAVSKANGITEDSVLPFIRWPEQHSAK